MCKNKGTYCWNDSETFDGYCSYCVKEGYAGAKPVKEKKPIAKESKKRAKENRLDREQNKKLREERPWCEMKLPGCTGRATGTQHKKGRVGKNLTDLDNKIPACWNCNQRAESHDKEAKDAGVAISKHKK